MGLLIVGLVVAVIVLAVHKNRECMTHDASETVKQSRCDANKIVDPWGYQRSQTQMTKKADFSTFFEDWERNKGAVFKRGNNWKAEK